MIHAGEADLEPRLAVSLTIPQQTLSNSLRILHIDATEPADPWPAGPGQPVLPPFGQAFHVRRARVARRLPIVPA